MKIIENLKKALDSELKTPQLPRKHRVSRHLLRKVRAALKEAQHWDYFNNGPEEEGNF